MLGLALDCGVHYTAVALFEKSELVHAQLVHSLGDAKATLLEVCDPFEDFVRTYAVGAEVVIEIPVIYDTAHQKGDQRDIRNLAIVCGAIMRTCAPYVKSIAPIEPYVWKGQVPKEVTETRARAKLSTLELSRVMLPSAKNLRHNVWDAVGIGLWAWRYKSWNVSSECG